MSLPDGRGSQRCWFLFHPMYPMSRPEQPAFWRRNEVEYVDAVEHLEALSDEWERGGYEGLLGFSQGALFAAMLCARLEQRARTADHPHAHGRPSTRPPRFVILCNGFASPLPSNPELRWWRELETGALTTPALFLAGEHDLATPPEAVAKLAARFKAAEVHIVAGGAHAMPSKSADLDAIETFVREVTSDIKRPSAVSDCAGTGGGRIRGDTGVMATSSRAEVCKVQRGEGDFEWRWRSWRAIKLNGADPMTHEHCP